MYESFGAQVDGQAVEFRLFFPDATVDPTQYSNTTGDPHVTEVRVVGNFQRQLGGPDWDWTSAPVLAKTDHPNGVLYRHRIDRLPDGFYQYKYFVTFDNETRRWCGDPCARYVAGAEENPGFVVGGPHASVMPIGNRRPLQDLVLYELMIDDFTAGYRGGAAPVDAVRERIDYLVGLGVNAVQFMPWTAWRGGQFSWGYNVLLLQGHRRGAPEVASKLGRDLQHDELVRPSRKPALATEAVDLGGDGHQGVVGGLIGEVIQLRATQPQRPAPPMKLVPGHAQQQAVQTGQDRLALRPYGAQALHPRS